MLSDVGEFGIIDYFKKNIKASFDEILVGIGDDTAVIKQSSNSNKEKLLLFTTDMLVEDVHFYRQRITPFQLGWKAMAVNISDIAAMGGMPKFALSSIGLPANIPFDFVKEMIAGIREIGDKFGIELVGGDTNASSKIIINISMLGEVEREDLCLRSTANVGNKIFVTGNLGDSAAGLLCLQQSGHDTGSIYGCSGEWSSLINRHLMPYPRVNEARLICNKVSSMIDISDGLSTEIYHICKASNVGANIYLEHIPISKEAKDLSARLNKDPLNLALYGGEDYELLFTSSCNDMLPNAIHIGEITEVAQGLWLINGNGEKRELKPKGFEHFVVSTLSHSHNS